MSALLDLIKTRPVFYDGSMGATILNMGLTPEDYGGQSTEGYNDYLSVVKPDVIRQIHSSFLEVGADVLETNTFGSSVIKAEEYGLGDQAYDINLASAQLAREVADEYTTASKQRFVVGSIGPSGLLPASEDPMLGNNTFKEVRDLFIPQIRGLIDGGVDGLIIETVQDILELKATIFAARQVFEETGKRVPIQASITLMPSGTMLLGTDIGAALSIVEHLGVDIIGLNCSTGPDLMREPARYLGEHSTLPVSIIPNAGLPENQGGIAVFPMTPEPFARELRDMVEHMDVGIVGGCCGTTPDHITEVIREVTTNPVTIAPRPTSPRKHVASMITATDIAQEPSPTIVGERVNTLGSRKVKRLILNDDLDGVVNVAVGQMEEGAHLLDVSVATTEREADEEDLMRRMVKKLALAVSGGLVIDTTEANVVEAALEQYPGRAIINSINMENGRKRIESVMPLAMAHGAAVVALTIDEDGMAKTSEKKLEVAQKIYKIVTEEYGLAPHDLIFDALTFPLTTGDDEFRPSAVETIEGIRLIKEALPGVNFTLGISNVSFGINPAARKVVNAVFLNECIKAGLTQAIIHPSHVLPLSEIPEEEVELARDLVLNTREDALARIIEHYEGRTEDESSKGPDPMLEMNVRDRLYHRIVHRKKEGVEADIDQAVIEADGDAVDVLNNVLLPAMKEVGDKFGAGELILPFVLQSAETMKKAVNQLENYLEKVEGSTKGTVVLATVYGDVHDIGKNLVNTILTNNGYTVVDLGKQVPTQTIIDAAVEHNATAIGLSALLVSTSKQMPLAVQELHRAGLQFPVMIGGAAINPAYAHRALFPEEGIHYEPGVFYAKDAFEGLNIMDTVVVPDKLETLREATLERARKTLNKPARASFMNTADEDDTERSETRIVDPPTPPFWGVKELRDIPLKDIWPHMDMKTLFRLHWGGKGVKGEEWERLQQEEFYPRLEAMQKDAEEAGWLEPRVRYGYFPCNSEGNDLIIYDPENHDVELERMKYPRQPARERLCLADYFLPVTDGRKDVVALQVVTMSEHATVRTTETQARGDYTESYFSHGLSVSAAEGLAEWIHQRTRAELGIGEETGKRYSWGYPSCPDLEHHVIVDRLLDMGKIGVEVTDSYMFNPEQTTAAIVVPHPDAKYFALLRTGGDKLTDPIKPETAAD